jgi:3-hydroxyacyl-CoA dehydrogenase
MILSIGARTTRRSEQVSAKQTRKIEKAAILGSGVMGMAIASHLAGCEIECLVLDIVPFDSMLKEEERELRDKGNRKIRNKLADEALQRALKFKPPQPAFYSPNDARLITTGNFDDDMEKIGDCDLIVEVVVERMDIKKSIFGKIDKYRSPDSIVATNTSGLSITEMVEDCSESMRRHFLGTHFFNPVRFMKLLEIIPHPECDPEIIKFVEYFGTNVLGKGVIHAKNTPNFIANRIGVQSMFLTLQQMIELDYRIDEIDTICGKPVGNPRSAVYKTADLVGLDTLHHVAMTIYNNCPNDESRDLCKPPELLDKMIAQGWLGRKAKGGFYQRGPNKERLVLDWKTMEYIPEEKHRFPSLGAVRDIEDPAERLKKLISFDDRAAIFAWKVIAGGVLYAARRIPEIADHIFAVDQGMRWGFNRELGPFEAWDAIGLRESVDRMKKEAYDIPENISKMLELGNESFYKTENGTRYQYDLVNHKYIPIVEDKNILIISKLPAQSKVAGNDGVTLWHIGDGVLLYEMHTPKANAIDNETIAMQNKAVELLEAGKYEAMIIGGNAENFCVGANLMMVLMAVNAEQLDEVEKMVYAFQKANMLMKYCSRPIIGVPIGYTFGGGCELIQHCHRVVGAAEAYIGLVEVGVGLIPAGGGTKEMMLRSVEHIDTTHKPSLLPFVRKAFENIATAEVAIGFKRAIDVGYLRPNDVMIVNADHRLIRAKEIALGMAASGFNPGKPRTDIPVVGESGTAAFRLAAQAMKDSGWATEYDLMIANKLAYIIGGGKRADGQTISEWEILDLEREVFMSLLGETRTQERIQHMLMHRKPLRN